jgi:hypothetical protein
MPTDAKCGLLVGVGLVLAVAVLFFQKEPAPTDPPAPAAQVQVASPAAALKPPDSVAERGPESTPLAPGRPVSRVDDDPFQSQFP